MIDKLRIIFLDIDGVMNHEKLFEAMDPICPNAIKLLNELVQYTDARIVISSHWRTSYALTTLQRMFQDAGFDWPERIIGTTIDLAHISYYSVKRTRGQEIDLWLQQVPVHSFVILDDYNDMDHLLDHLVQTTFDKGLTSEHVEKAKEILMR